MTRASEVPTDDILGYSEYLADIGQGNGEIDDRTQGKVQSRGDTGRRRDRMGTTAAEITQCHRFSFDPHHLNCPTRMRAKYESFIPCSPRMSNRMPWIMILHQVEAQGYPAACSQLK